MLDVDSIGAWKYPSRRHYSHEVSTKVFHVRFNARDTLSALKSPSRVPVIDVCLTTWTHISRMAGIKDRVYLADSKIIVRRKLGLDKEQNDEEFAKLEVASSFTDLFLQD